jgi:hypothetical protein
MFSSLRQMSQLRNWNRWTPNARAALAPTPVAPGVAGQLMESADALAGLDPHQAHELRLAARAYLSVVR